MDARERREIASEAAADWWIRMDGRELQRPEREQFIDWLRESPVHVSEMLRIARIHDALADFQGWVRIARDLPAAGLIDERTVLPFPSPSTSGAVSRPRILRRRRFLAAMAASVLALVLVAGAAWFAFGAGSDWQTIETERGERREVALADGSVLRVGPETRLRVRLTELRRQVMLDHGATLFRVAKNPRRPFTVEAHHTLVQAVGTAFGVEQRAQAVVVTVAEGKIAVLQEHETAGPARNALLSRPKSATPQDDSSAIAPGDQSVILIAGQQIAVPRIGRIGLIHKVDSERELAWAVGRLVFQNDAISTVIEQFNRYNRVQIIVADESLARRTISGVFDASDPESFIAFIASVTPVRVARRADETITLIAANASAESTGAEIPH
jgi:transmembrane sensor